ncbi:MAG TPA: protein translocase subunit SecF [Candidatus Paceibacterota bacterium]
MKIIKYRKIFYCFSALLFAISIWAISAYGLKPGIDFTGGSLLNVSYEGATPTVGEVNDALSVLDLGGISVRNAGDDSFIIRTKEIDQSRKAGVMALLSIEGKYVPIEKEFNTVGPVLGIEAINKSYLSIILVLVAIILFITFAFRKVSKPISSWVYGGVALVALAHDVIIPTGIFAILGHFQGFEVDTLFVTALLVILGFSIHDTIVVFDRVRENLKISNDRGGKEEFEAIVGRSISETFTRSINTSVTTLLAIVVLYFFGPEATKHFALTMGIGIIAGTYSSIFFGSPLLVTIQKWRNKV